jgi:hypothetical protein
MKRAYLVVFGLFLLGLSCNVEVLERLWPGNVNFTVTESATNYASGGAYYDFGTSSGSATFTIENQSSAEFTLYDIELQNTGAGFTLTNTPSTQIVIEGFGRYSFDVNYTDNTTKRDTQVLISTNASGVYRLGVAGGGSTLNLGYTNIEIEGYRLGTYAYEFGYMTSSASPTITLRNDEKFTIDIASVVEANDTYDVFEITGDPTGVLAPGATTTFNLAYTYDGATPRMYRAQADISANAGRSTTLYFNATNRPEPSDILSGPVLWLDANKITSVTDDGGTDKVVSWPDRSGNGWNAVAANSNIAPAYGSIGNWINNQPVIDFSVGDVVLETELRSGEYILGPSGSTEAAVFIVLNLGSTYTNDEWIMEGSNGGMESFPRVKNDRRTGSAYRWQIAGLSNQWSTGPDGNSAGASYILAGIHDNTMRIAIYENGGELLTTGNSNIAAEVLRFLKIGNRLSTPSITTDFSGYISEIIIFDSKLTVERDDVELYLNLKYNIW